MYDENKVKLVVDIPVKTVDFLVEKQATGCW